MRRIQPNGCGYDGFICKGLTRLRDIFMQTPVDIYRTDNPTDDDWVWTNDTSVVYGHTYSQQQECIDNYAQVPQSFEGFVMTLTPVIDMSGGTNTIEVPEIACRTNMDPFTTELSVLNPPNETYTVNPNTVNTGLIDLYNQVPKYNDDVYAYIGDDREQQHLKISIKPAYKFTIGPGLLEPMLDTMFPPIGVDTIPSTDTMGDFTVWLFDEFNTWKGLVDDRLRNLYQIVPSYDYSSINGLLNLGAALNREGPCDNFTIVAGYNDSPLFVTGSTTSGKYSILGGTIYVNGNTSGIPVPADLSDIQAPFEAYLDYDIEGNTASIQVKNDDRSFRRQENHLYYYIGGVRLVRGGTESVIEQGTDFSLYEIIQEDCLSDITIGGGTSTPCNPYEYEGPFKVIAGTTSGTVALAPFDDIGADPQLYTGFVVNGDLTIPAPIGSVDVGVYADVYAKIDLNTNNVSYEMEEPATDTQEQQEEQEDTPPDPNIVHVRLARISRGSIQYETVVLGGSTTGYNGNIKGDTVSIYSDFCAAPTPGLFPIELNKDVQFVTGGTVYEVIGGTLTGNYGVAPSGGTYAATVYATQEFDILQIQHGDIVLCGSTVTPEPPVVGSTYSGPFHIIQDSDGLTFECLKTDQQQHCVEIGDLVINGYIRTPIGMTAISGSTASDSTYIYAHITSPSAVTFDTDPSPSGTPPAYTVRLAKITGATTTEATVDGQTVYELHGGTIDILQYHYGDLYVDGRWS